MKTWLMSWWESLRTNFWFVPTIMVVGAILLSLATIQVDRASGGQNGVAALGWTFTRGPEGSRALLAAVAGSMMTITSVTFSITIVALQLATSQFGPRLLRNFMRDRGNQVALGTFIATFAYCLLILRTVNGTEDQRFVPHLSVTVGLLMTLVSLGVLIYFIHHAAASIQAENVIAAVGQELSQAIGWLYPERAGSGATDVGAPDPRRELPAGSRRESRPIESDRSDYLEAIDVERLMALAEEHDLILELVLRPGKFALKGGNLARAWPGDRLDDRLAAAIRGAFYFGRQRTLTQDVEFAIDQLVEIALRALSPGVNDPFTAITCVDRLGEALCELAGRRIPSPYRCDDAGRLRLVTAASTVAGLVDAAFQQIRQAARGDAAVTLRLLETIAAVARRTPDPEFQDALRRHALLIHRGSQEGLPDPYDRAEADRRYEQALRNLESQIAPPAAGSPRPEEDGSWRTSSGSSHPTAPSRSSA